jgi:16S rRNA (uracil1498-N3)-methyltransferase
MADHHHFLFFADRIDADTIELDAEEARHIVTVLRHAAGDSIQATTGDGIIYECRIEFIDRARVSAAILNRRTIQRHVCPLHLFVGLSERDSFEILVTDLAALGVERITPIVAGHCQRPWWKPWSGKPAARLRGKMVAGMKQSRYSFMPILDPPLPFMDIGGALSGLSVVADAQGSPFSAMIEKIKKADDGYSCIVGPPGGFTEDETASLQALGAVPVRIAASRLTTELAAVVLASQIMGVRLP